MARNEFDLIARYFESQSVARRDVALGIGDDCALLEVPEGCQLAVSTDTLAAGTHFLVDADPELVAHKALAANLSDLAAMGATPAWVSLALTLPESDEAWLGGFCQGFFALAEHYNLQLVGGDTTKGPLSITITVHGFVPKGEALTRSGAGVGDWVYVTGDIGDSAAGLALLLNEAELDDSMLAETLIQRHYLSEPRILAGQALRRIASAALDISDGVMSDLNHIVKRSGVGAVIDVDALPLSDELLAFTKGDRDRAQQIALTSGEEYELCFTVSEQNRGAIETTLAASGVKATCIGQLFAGDSIRLQQQGKGLAWQLHGYDHFAE